MKPYVRPSLIISMICALLLQSFTVLHSQQAKHLPSVQESADSFFHFRQTHYQAGQVQKPLLVPGFDYPVDSCFTYTYKLKIGDVTGQTIIRSNYTSTDGTTYFVGEIVASAGDKQGFLQQVDQSGNIILSRSVQQPGRHIVLQSIHQMVSGNFVLIGTSSLPDGTDKKILLAEINAAGNLQWTKSLSVTGYSGMGISPTISNGIGFCGNDDTTIVFGKLDYNGNLLWLKRSRLMESGAIAGMVKYDYDSWYIAYNGIDSSRHVGMLLCIDPANGNVRRANRFGGPAMNSDFIFKDLALTNIRPKITAIYSSNNGPYQLCRITINPSGYIEMILHFAFPGIIIDTTASVAIDSRAEVIAFTPTNTATALFTFKTINEAYPDTLIYWAKKFTGIGQNEIACVAHAFDGGSFITTSIHPLPGSTQSFTLKTDSTGWIKNCAGENLALINTAQFGAPGSIVLPAVSIVPAVLTSEGVVANTTAIPYSVECKTLSCPAPTPEDSCLVGFNRRYRSADFCDLGIDLLLDAQNNITAVGLARDNPVEPETEKAFFAKMNARGKLLERKKVNLGNQTYFPG